MLDRLSTVPIRTSGGRELDARRWALNVTRQFRSKTPMRHVAAQRSRDRASRSEYRVGRTAARSRIAQVWSLVIALPSPFPRFPLPLGHRSVHSRIIRLFAEEFVYGFLELTGRRYEEPIVTLNENH